MTRSVLALALFVVACGDSASAKFIGTWTIVSATDVVTCNGVSQTIPTTGNTTIAAGTATDLEVVDSSGCNTAWNVSGSSATATPGQTCSSTSNGTTTVVNFASGTITTTDGKTLVFSYSGSASINGATCTFSENGSATKIAK